MGLRLGFNALVGRSSGCLNRRNLGCLAGGSLGLNALVGRSLDCMIGGILELNAWVGRSSSCLHGGSLGDAGSVEMFTKNIKQTPLLCLLSASGYTRFFCILCFFKHKPNLPSSPATSSATWGMPGKWKSCLKSAST